MTQGQHECYGEPRNLVNTVIRHIGSHYAIVGSGLQVYRFKAHGDARNDATVHKFSEYSPVEGLNREDTDYGVGIPGLVDNLIFRSPQALDQRGIKGLQEFFSKIRTR